MRPTALLIPFLCGALAAQDLEPGYADRLHALPNGVGNTLVLEHPDAVVWFDGTKLVLDDGQTTRALLTLANSTFGSFTIRADRDHLFFGESGNGDLWLVPLAATGQPRVVANLPFNYDAILFAPGQVLVSAKVGGFSSADNDVVLVDLATGNTDLIARLPGASGPLARTRTGIIYATATTTFPPPPGSVDLLTYSDAQVLGALGPNHLGPNDARVLASGFDAAGDLAIDHDGDVFLTDWLNARVVEVSGGPGGGGRVSVLLEYAAGVPSASGLQFVRRGRGHGIFEPFQPDGHHELVVFESQFGGTSQLRDVRPIRPRTTTSPASPISAGPFSIVTTGAPAGGSAIVAIGPRRSGTELPLFLALWEQPLFWDAAMLHAFATWSIPVGSDGVATLALVNPGIVGRLRLGVQVAVIDATAGIVGSAGAIDVVFR